MRFPVNHYLATYGGQPVPVVQAFLHFRRQGHELHRVTLIDDAGVPQHPERLKALTEWFTAQDVNGDVLSSAHPMRKTLPARLQDTLVNVTGGTKELALRVADVALREGCTVFATDAHHHNHRIHFLSDRPSEVLSSGLGVRDAWKLSVAPAYDLDGELGGDEGDVLKRHATRWSGAHVFILDGARKERELSTETDQFAALSMQNERVSVLSLSPIRDRSAARTFAEFVRRSFGEAARVAWDHSSLRHQDLGYVATLGEVLNTELPVKPLPAPLDLPPLPALRGDVLVCVVGHQPMPAVVAALHGQPTTVILLTTRDQTAVVGRIRTFLQRRGVNVQVSLLDEYKPAHFRQYMEDLSSHIDDNASLRLNISGGTKAMALNAFLGMNVAANRTVEYTRGQSVVVLRPDILAPVVVPTGLSLKERLNLFGLDASDQQLRTHQFRNARVQRSARHLIQQKVGPGFDAALEQFKAAWHENQLPAGLLETAETQARIASRQGPKPMQDYANRWRGFAFEAAVYAELVKVTRANQPGRPTAVMGVEVQLQQWHGDAQTGHDARKASASRYEREADALLEVDGNILLVEAKLGLMRGIREAQEHLDAVELAQRLGGRYTHTMIVGAQLPDVSKLKADDQALWNAVLAGSRLDGAYSLHVLSTGSTPLPDGVWHWNGTALEESVKAIVKGMGS